jgi:hypothetical protein
MEQSEPSINDLLSKAEEARKNKDNALAIVLYYQVLKQIPCKYLRTMP